MARKFRRPLSASVVKTLKAKAEKNDDSQGEFC